MAKATKKGKKSSSRAKDTYTLNPPREPKKKIRGAPASDQDIKRRIGNFEGAGEPPMRGARGTGIGGQTKQKFRTDNKKTGKTGVKKIGKKAKGTS